MDSRDSAESLVIWQIGHTQPQIMNKIHVQKPKHSNPDELYWARGIAAVCERGFWGMRARRGQGSHSSTPIDIKRIMTPSSNPWAVFIWSRSFASALSKHGRQRVQLIQKFLGACCELCHPVATPHHPAAGSGGE